MIKSKKFIFLLLSVFLLLAQTTKLYSHTKHINSYKKYPYLEFNAKQILGYIISCIALMANLHNKGLFKNANAHEIKNIKAIAQKLEFSQKNINKLQVKKPVKYTYFDHILKDNYAAFSNTILIGRQDHVTLNNIIKDPKVLKFIYAHELSHIKYNHTLKTFIAFAISPIIIHFSIAGFNKLFNHFISKTNLRKTNGLVSSGIKLVPKILNSITTKIFAQMALWIMIRKQFEKNADLNAASLGPDIAQGGIKFLEATRDIEIIQKKDILNQYDNKVIIYMLKIVLACKSFLQKLLHAHPSHETRIKYLQNSF